MTTEVEQYQAQYEQNKKQIALRDAAIKLSTNRDFIKVIRESFMVTECARYAQVSGDPSIGEAERADALALAQAAGHLKRFLSVTIRMGNQAEVDNASLMDVLNNTDVNGEVQDADE